MKIIDLYNMVANGEQPNKFKYKNRWFAYSVDDKEFRTLKQEVYNGDYPEYIYLSELIDLSNLNDEVEMINYKKQYIINEDRLIELLEEEDKLYLLECAGVDNWPGYDYAFEDREELDIEKILEEEFKEVK